jgi:hypothetical protein
VTDKIEVQESEREYLYRCSADEMIAHLVSVGTVHWVHGFDVWDENRTLWNCYGERFITAKQFNWLKSKYDYENKGGLGKRYNPHGNRTR